MSALAHELRLMNVQPLDHAPTLHALESQFDLLFAEAERLMEHARNALARVQDADAELEGAGNPGALMLRNKAAHELRGIARQLTRAHCCLVHPSDERHGAARQVFRWADEAEPADAPWRDAA